MSEVKRRIRCAVYTRKSHEEGLEQEFNSLDAQREAGEAYVASQRSEGWTLVPDYYDDGGFTGANMERPALKRLMKDIEAGLIDVVVVYKIDRLTRALLDFARMITLFDQHNVSFVSVTQQFNTTTSMGRLMLNVLLSFAQFEREVTGERIRDKLAASKRKGMWMGGTPPLGYDVIDRKLVINEKEAEIVRMVFRRFIALKSVTALVAETREKNYRTKTYTSRSGRVREGKVMDKGTVYHLLGNRLYLGEITHHENVYPGLHEAIIDRETWDRAHAAMEESPRTRANKNRRAVPSPLRGVLRCAGCDCGMTPSSTRRHGRLYRYYVPNNHLKKSCLDCPVGSVAAGEIEGIVLDQLQEILTLPEMHLRAWEAARKLDPSASENDVRQSLGNIRLLWNELFPAEQERLVRMLVEEVSVGGESVDIAIRPEGVEALMQELHVRKPAIEVAA